MLVKLLKIFLDYYEREQAGAELGQAQVQLS